MLKDRFKCTLVKNRYGKRNTIIDRFNNLDLDFAMKSINQEKFTFTNHVKSLSSEQYIELKKIYCDYKSGKNILDRFEGYEIEIYSKNFQRLCEILSYNCMETIDKNRMINILKFQLKDKENKKLRIYIEKKNDNFKVMLIDLFHLAIPSEHYNISPSDMLNLTYSKNKKNPISIGEIKRYYKLEKKLS